MPTITTALSKNFKIELLKGNHDLTAADIRIANWLWVLFSSK